MKNLKKWYINLSIQRKILYCTLGVALVVLLAASVSQYMSASSIVTEQTSSDPKIDASFMETNSQKIIRKNGYKVTVKIFTDLRPFLERLDSMNDHRERTIGIYAGFRFLYGVYQCT